MAAMGKDAQPKLVLTAAEIAGYLKIERTHKWANEAKEQQHQAASRAGKAAWANLSPEERSAELKRRAAKREKRK